MVTIAAPPGIGKSRLAGEFLAGLADTATVLVGRCLAYGEGTTFRALADIVRGLGGDDPRQRVEELLDGDEQAVRGILGAIGRSEEPARAEETAWALRRLLERLSRERPLVVAVEDIHWAEPPMLELLDHVVTLSAGAPILLVCLTRPELLESRPEWATPQSNRAVMVLDPLGDADARELAERLGAGGHAQRIVQRAEGNPLFVQQLVAVDEGQDTAELPASIQAVLAARIDGLDDGERMLLQHAAVEGRTFHAGALALLLPEEGRRALGSRLVVLARKGLIGGDQPEFAGEDAFRFTHALIRDAAYAGLPKLERAHLHAGVAAWLERHAAAADEIVGHHLEQACRLAADLGRAVETYRPLAVRAVARLRAASRAALGRARPGPGVHAAGARPRARGPRRPRAGRAASGARRGAVRGGPDGRGDARCSKRRWRPAAIRARRRARMSSASSYAWRRRRRPRGALAACRGRGDGGARGSRRRPGDVPGACSCEHRRCGTRGASSEADDAWRRAAEHARGPGDERDLFDVLGWRASAAVARRDARRRGDARCEEFRAVVAASPVAVPG